MIHNYSYNPSATVTLDNFRALFGEWDREDSSIEHILAGMITILQSQELHTEVDAIIKAQQSNM